MARGHALPALDLSEKESNSMLKPNIKKALQAEIVGQDKAIEAIDRIVTIAECGIFDPERPLGTFLFLGPTGTGKSQIGRSLAKIMHGTNAGLVVINCTEFKNPHDISKLTGAPPGYIGHDHPPFLTPEKIEKRGTVIIFEEIEKADCALYDLLLQILDKGELKTGMGVDLNFRNCFIILTSNVGTREIDHFFKPDFGFVTESKTHNDNVATAQDDKINSLCLKAVEQHFSPEFINRIDEIVPFNYLKKEHLYAILDRLLIETKTRLSRYSVYLSINQKVKDFLIEKGTNLHYGARPLKRAIREYFEYNLSVYLMAAKREGAQALSLIADMRDSQIVFMQHNEAFECNATKMQLRQAQARETLT